MNNLNLICFDFETGGLIPGFNEVVQVAGQVYNPRTLEPISAKNGGTFSSMMKVLHPERIEEKALQTNKKTIEQIMASPDPSVVWNQFVNWVMKWNPKKSNWTAPIALGKNIRDFDLKFAEYLNIAHCPNKEKTVLFNTRRQIDLEDFIFYWWENSNELPNEKMDTLRDYFGLNSEGAHDALVDVLQTGELIMKFLKLNRTLKTRVNADGEPLIKFKGSCKK